MSCETTVVGYTYILPDTTFDHDLHDVQRECGGVLQQTEHVCHPIFATAPSLHVHVCASYFFGMCHETVETQQQRTRRTIVRLSLLSPPMSEDKEARARHVFSSFLKVGNASSPASSSSASAAPWVNHVASHADAYYSERIAGKYLQLANLDRSRPKPEQGSIPYSKIHRRNQRVQRKSLQPCPIRRHKDDNCDPKIKTPLSRRQRKDRGMEEVDANTT